MKARKALNRKHRALRRRKGKQWCYVYVIRAAKNSEPRYVGQTRQRAEERLLWHYKVIYRRLRQGLGLSPAQQWLEELRCEGIAPVIEIIDQDGVWDLSEAVWIDRLRQQGADLFNITSVTKQPERPILWEVFA